MAFKLVYLRAWTAKAIQNIHDLNLVRRAQNDLILNRNSSGFLAEQSVSGFRVQFESSRSNHNDRRERQNPIANNDEDQPIKYSTSKAAKYRAAENFRLVGEDKYPPSQRWIVNISLITFMIYFFILREENDLDSLFDRSLFETVPQLERPILEASLVNADRVGLSGHDIQQRLDELDEADRRQQSLKTNQN